MVYTTETCTVDEGGKVINAEDKRKFYSVQPEAYDQYLEEVKQRRRPMRQWKPIPEEEEEEKEKPRLDPHLILDY